LGYTSTTNNNKQRFSGGFMLKNDNEVLSDLKALYVMSKATMPYEERKFFMLALFAVATQWGVEAKFSNVVNRVELASQGCRCQACSD
jgi:hypothetical protein